MNTTGEPARSRHFLMNGQTYGPLGDKEMRRILRKYYILVDEGRFDDVFGLFSGDVVYRRCEKEIRGIGELRSFYLHERSLAGRHVVENVLTDGYCWSAVRGRFEGTDGKSFGFSDHFAFDDSGRIRERQTYLAIGFDTTV